MSRPKTIEELTQERTDVFLPSVLRPALNEVIRLVNQSNREGHISVNIDLRSIFPFHATEWFPYRKVIEYMAANLPAGYKARLSHRDHPKAHACATGCDDYMMVSWDPNATQ